MRVARDRAKLRLWLEHFAPPKVTRTALQNAASVSALMLTTEAMVCEIPEKKSAAPAGPGHGPEMDY